MNTINITVPSLPESIVDATIISWHKSPGDIIKENEVVADIETDKIILEIPSPCHGRLQSILANKGQIVSAGQIIGILVKQEEHTNNKFDDNKTNHVENKKDLVIVEDDNISPTVRRLLTQYNLKHVQINGTGLKGRITKEDITDYIHNNNLKPRVDIKNQKDTNQNLLAFNNNYRNVKRIKMNKLRRVISEKLLLTKNNIASVTTFNEVNMQPILTLRKTYGELFKKKHGIKLGLMSFYVKAVVAALKKYPMINATIDKDEIVYYNYFDINIAISTSKGLVAPILKNVDLMSMDQIEKNIQELAVKSRNYQLSVNDLINGNFTITNGGVFGSLFSTPLINPPQSAILGMHVIKERPVVSQGSIKIFPMMYLALTYDHRLIDGKESVGFLLTIKELLEDFNRIILNV